LVFAGLMMLAQAQLPAVALAQDDKGRKVGEAGDGKTKSDPEKRDKGVEEPAADESPIPKLPPERLPPRTGAKPDPEKEQFQRGYVNVKIKETVTPRQGDPYQPDPVIVEAYLAEYFRRAGFDVIEDAALADYRVQGEARCDYKESLIFRGQTFGLKFVGSASIEILDASGKSLGSVAIPPHDRDGALSEKKSPAAAKAAKDAGAAKSPTDTPVAADGREEHHVVKDFRRELAKLLWDRIFHQIKPFADPEIPHLLASLAQEDLESDDPVDAKSIIDKLVRRRFEAVPYLIEALSDERPVLVSATYPGLTALNTDKLRIYHIADKALEEIFQKVSRMNLSTSKELRFVIIRGWEQEWRRFCKPFRESKSSRAQDEKTKGPRSGSE
jgi:hypothetical protein